MGFFLKGFRDSERVNTNASEISFHFACMKHTSEEYAYYSPSERT